jgi:hypothetical protein
MHMNIHGATLVPCRKQDTAFTTVVLHILERVHHVGDEAKAERAAEGDAGNNTKKEKETR